MLPIFFIGAAQAAQEDDYRVSQMGRPNFEPISYEPANRRGTAKKYVHKGAGRLPKV